MAGAWRYNDVRPVTGTLPTATLVNKCDLVARNSSGELVPAASWTWDTNEATTRAAFVAAFYGCSGQDKATAVARVYGNSTDNVLVCYSAGVYEYDCESATYTTGQLLGPAKDTGNNLLSSTLKGVTLATEATHVVEKPGTTVTRIMCRMRSVGLTL